MAVSLSPCVFMASVALHFRAHLVYSKYSKDKKRLFVRVRVIVRVRVMVRVIVRVRPLNPSSFGG